MTGSGRAVWLLPAAVAATALLGASRTFAQCDLAKLLAADAETGDEFGFAAALSGDYAIVGAPRDDDAGESSGAAYVYRRMGTAWIQKAKWTAKDAAPLDFFGATLAMDGTTAVVAAVLDDEAADDGGALYVYRRNGNIWSFEAKLLAADASEDDELGTSVAVSGSYILAGARNDAAGEGAGAAYVFFHNGAAWSQQAKLTASDAAPGDDFGAAVGISGDYLVVGAPQDNTTQIDTGSAYVFKRVGTAWTQQAKLVAADAGDGDEFGRSVAISGDYLIAGARLADVPNFNNAGAAYVFKRNGNLWSQQAKLTPADPNDNDLFGGAVSLGGDYALVGARQDDDGGTNSGSAYVFKRNGTSWLQTVKLTAFDDAAMDNFGFVVAISGSHALVGAPYNADFGPNTGSAYVFGAANDCNGNGNPDPCDLLDGSSRDQNGDGVPDECGVPGGDFDFDHDLDIDARDFRELQNCFRRVGGLTPGCAVFDAEPDGDVDLDDAATFTFVMTGP